jgi:hypothetical protein
MGRVIFALRYIADSGSEAEGLRRPPKIHQDRDAWVLGTLAHLLRRPGDQVESLFNIPGVHLEEPYVRRLMHPGDLVLVATRLPVNERSVNGDDARYYARKPVIPGNNWLEDRILDCCRRFFAWCNRKYVLLTPEGASCLAAGYRDRAYAHFHATDDAKYERVSNDVRQDGPIVHPGSIDWHNWRASGPGASTAGYMVYVKELWSGGPGCLAMFGMSGPTTFGFVSAVTEIWSSALPFGVDFDDSELIFVEISAGGHDVPLTPPQTDGHPTYWRRWQFAWNRRGELTDWPRQCPPRVRPD